MVRKVYQVKISVPTDLSVSYEEWLKKHVKDMLDLGCFEWAEMFEVKSLDAGTPSKVLYCCQYHYKEDEDFHLYLEKHAPQMRNQLPADFLGKLEFERSLMDLVDHD